jgi:predicted NUDIX family NTP pyrophosphohydrolase
VIRNGLHRLLERRQFRRDAGHNGVHQDGPAGIPSVVQRLERATGQPDSRGRRAVPKVSAGLLMYRIIDDGALQVLLVHPGGPLWARKQQGAWFLPKGELHADEDPLQAARREFAEETGVEPGGPYTPLGEVRHKSGKRVIAWSVAGSWDPSALRSNTFRLEWPPRSGRYQEFPEIDRAVFWSIAEARIQMHEAERPFLDRLLASLHLSQ